MTLSYGKEMGARTLTTVVTSDTIALSAAVFGFAGHSIVTPHEAIEQIWWTEERINKKVTPKFIASRLRSDQRSRLFEQPAFASDDLTDSIYLDWILRNAKRLFLALLGCDKADHIFDLVDAAWDDDDLPIELSDVKYLVLAPSPDEQLNRRFYSCQHEYLLRQLCAGIEVRYGSNETIPIEYVCKLPPAAALQDWRRFHLPKQSNRTLIQRKTKLFNNGPGSPELAAFRAQAVVNYTASHPHIAPLWATYSSKNCVYAVFDFVPEHTLRSFIEFRVPASFRSLSEAERTRTLLNWVYCLISAVTYMHQNSLPCPHITPSNIVIDANNQIAFAEVGREDAFQRSNSLTYLELYNYEAPEQQAGPGPPSARSSLDMVSERASLWIRRVSAEIFPPAIQPSPIKSECHRESPARASPSRPFPDSPSLGLIRIDSRIGPNSGDLWWPARSMSTSSPSYGSSGDSSPICPPTVGDRTQQADIFSLGCVLLDITSFMLRRRPYSEFVKFRSSKYQLGGKYKRKHINASFHANREKVMEWVEILNGQGSKVPSVGSRLLNTLLQIIKSMLNIVPRQRLTAHETLQRIEGAMQEQAIMPPKCCRKLNAIQT